MSAFIEVTLISLGLAFLLSLIYRILTKPEELRRIKKEMKFYQEKSKEAQKAGDTAKSNEYMKDMMKVSQGQFKMNMKPMLASMVIFFLLLGWMNGAYGNIVVDSSNPDAAFSYRGAEHQVYYEMTGEDPESFRAGIDFDNNGDFSQDEIFERNQIFPYSGVSWRSGPAGENIVQFEMLITKAPVAVPFIGYYLGWFWWYILITIPCTMLFRKLLGVD